MAGNLWGADVAQLRTLAQQFGKTSVLLEAPGVSLMLQPRALDDEKHLLVRHDGKSWATGVPDFATDEVTETGPLDNAGLLSAIEESRGAA